jgi:prepilin-type N-terminal cleavage/methylation domain-containing protein
MKRRAFTLIEILVVVGILVLLAAIALPLIGKAMRQAKRTRTAADLASIATALEAYKADHGDYPRVAINLGVTSAADRPNPMTGAQVLCRALLGLAPAVDPNPVAGQNLKQDGKDGPGFSVREGTKGYGPYLAIEKFKVSDGAAPLLQTILDQEGNPILYFPRGPKSNQSLPNGYIALSAANAEGVVPFDARDNLDAFRRTGETDAQVLTRIRVAFGDEDDDGGISKGETARYDAPFVLWSAGSDGKYGPDADTAPSDGTLDRADVDKMDDVTTGGSK